MSTATTTKSQKTIAEQWMEWNDLSDSAQHIYKELDRRCKSADSDIDTNWDHMTQEERERADRLYRAYEFAYSAVGDAVRSAAPDPTVFDRVEYRVEPMGQVFPNGGMFA